MLHGQKTWPWMIDISEEPKKIYVIFLEINPDVTELNLSVPSF